MSGPSFVRFLVEDEHFFVVLKPPKVAVHPSAMCRDKRTLLHMVRNKGGGEHVYAVHRLDRGVSGPVLFARSPEMAATLQEQFYEGKVSKFYLALVRGWAEKEGKIDHDLKKPNNGELQSCLTTYQSLAYPEIDKAFGVHASVRYSLILTSPVTGRFHQLRRHLRDISRPIIGDTTDGDSHQNRFFREEFGVQRLMLHACFLAFDHPITGERIRVFQEPDAELKQVFEKLEVLKVLDGLEDRLVAEDVAKLKA